MSTDAKYLQRTNGKFDKYIERAKSQHGDAFSRAGLDKRFIPFFNSGERIRVEFKHGEVQTGTIGVTTGWKPCFLLMLKSNSVGSVYTLGKDDTIVAVQKGVRYFPLNGASV